jgi:hypothetical protein
MHHSRTRLLVVAAELLRDVGLVLAKQLGVQADVAGGIDTVNVAAGIVRLTASEVQGDWRLFYPKPAAMEKYLEIGRKACSLQGN